MHWINYFNLERNHRWQTLFSFLLPCLTKGRKCRHRNSLLHNGYISKFLALKANAQYLSETYSGESWKNLEKSSNNTGNKIARLQFIYINTKQNTFHINSVFLFSKTCFMIQKVIYWLLLIWYKYWGQTLVNMEERQGSRLHKFLP